jgi:hypothetical protein
MNKITNYNETIKNLAEWIEQLKKFAEGDSDMLISWFCPTKDYPFSIIGGWQECFSDKSGVDDLFCVSKTNPKYVMCVKIVINEGPYAYTDYEVMNMPYDPLTNEVDDTEQMLEWDDDPEELATWLLTEWERIMAEHEKEE